MGARHRINRFFTVLKNWFNVIYRVFKALQRKWVRLVVVYDVVSFNQFCNRKLFSNAGMEPQKITVELAFEQKGLGKNQALITEFISGSWATPPMKVQAF